MSTELSSDAAAQASASTGVAMKLEVTALPVSDIDRAKAFYEKPGWRLGNVWQLQEITERLRGRV